MHRDDLLSSARSFCDAFASKEPLDSILQHFTSITPDEIFIHEYGLERLAPFLGRDFMGLSGAKTYFELISSCLTYENMHFSNYIIDEVEKKVSVRGTATFTWTSTAQSWREVFTYVLAFDDHDKVLSYEIWADSGAASLASKGLLDQAA